MARKPDRKLQKAEKRSAVQALKYIRDDVREMEWSKLDDDNRTILVAKADVLQLIQDWIEFYLDPETTEATD